MTMKPENIAITAASHDFGDTLKNESSEDLLDRKLHQAAALSAMLYGDGLEPFELWSNKVKDGVLWLLHDTICEAIAARNAAGSEL